jgi:DNA-3-methyladenine glycosylase II
VKGKLTPKAVLAVSDQTLRGAGLSDSKANSIQNLAKWFVANPKLTKNLDALSNEKLIEFLTSISGIGVWTVNVFLIFHL